MRLITSILFFSISCLIIFAQDDDFYNEELTKKELKKLKKAEEKEMIRKSTILMIEKKHFVLEADYISNRYGKRYMVNSTLNFIKVDSTDIVLQLGSNSGMGYNGVGGITLDGQINRYEIKETKHGHSLRISSMTSLGTFDVFITVSNSGYADASVSGISGGSVRFSGNIIPLELSRIYKGSSL
ncbi:DUF4251 domain-containing protein [Bacteroidota bacterium]